MEALAIQERHLTIPQCALFSPIELQIAANCSEADFTRTCKLVAALGTANDMWIADASFYAIEHFGREHGLKIAAEATGYKSFSLAKSARVSEAFPPQKRFPDYSFNAYRFLLPFPVEWRDAFLARHVGESLTSRGLRLLAVKEFGSEPYKAARVKKRTVEIAEDIYEQVRTRIGKDGKIYFLVENMLKRWLAQTPVPAPVHTPEPVVEPEKRPTYAERRTAQLAADPAAKIPAKEKKLVKVKFAWTECTATQFVDSENGLAQYKGPHGSNPTKFYSEADALTAEAEHFSARGYHQRVKKCESCSGGNARKQVYHIYHVYPGALEGRVGNSERSVK